MKKIINIAVLVLLLAATLALPIQAAAGDPSAVAVGTTAGPNQLAYLTISLENCEDASSILVQYEAPAALTAEKDSSAWLLTGGALQDIDTANSMAVYTYDAPAKLNGEIIKLAFRMPKTMTETPFLVKYTVTIKESGREPLVLTGQQALTMVERPATGVALDKETLQLDLAVTPSASLVATATPEDTTDAFTWKSSNAAVAAVDAAGKVTGLKPGTATITVTVGSFSDSCTVTVTCSHSYGWKQTVAPQLLKEGTEVEVCLACGHETGETREVMHLHDAVQHAQTAGTCVAPGHIEYWTCEGKGCQGKHFTDKTCTTVHAQDTATAMDPDNHDGQKTQIKGAVAATCTKTGYTGDVWCRGCNKLISKGKEIPVKKHSYDWVIDKAPTEEETGERHQECTSCGLENGKKETMPKLEHDPQLVAGTPATCEAAGVAEHFFCTNCNRYYASNDGVIGEEITADSIQLPATGHSYSEEWASDATHHWHSCQCGDTADKAVHTEKVINAAEATADQPGYTGDTVCSVCGYQLATGEEIPALGATEPTVPGTQPADPNGSSWWIWVLVVLGAGGITVLLLWLQKRRKN